MTSLIKIFLNCSLIVILSNCSQVLQSVDLKLDIEQKNQQEEFNVIAKTLTINEAKKQNMSPYIRHVLQTGRGENAKSIPETEAIASKFPQSGEMTEYRIGKGDTLSFSRLIENKYSKDNIKPKWPEVSKVSNYRLGIGDTLTLTLLIEEKGPISRIQSLGIENGNPENENQTTLIPPQKNDTTIGSRGRIGSDGSVLLLEVGRLEAKDKTLNELRSEVRNILIRNGISPRFQLEIVDFKSQRAYLTINQNSDIIILDDQNKNLRDLLTSAEVGLQPGIVTRVKLQRNGEEYFMKLRDIFSQDSPEITILNRDHIFVEDSSPNVIRTEAIVGQDGNIVLASVGKIKALGRSLNDIKPEISSLIEKLPGSHNEFQIEVTNFSSQKALVNIPGKEGGVIPISSSLIALDEVLTENGLSIDGKGVTQINLQRQGKTFRFTLTDLLTTKSFRLYLKPNDRVLTKVLPYKESKVFVLGAVNPTIVTIDPTKRETLADVLFTSGGVLSSSSAKRSEVYLLRGSKTISAFHLDAQDPTRLIVADAMQLRPNDILYVAEQPIISFNRTLATIVPLRLLVRDIQDENIP